MNRITKAHTIVKLNQVGVLRRDRQGRITKAVVPGTDAKQYEVIVRREGWHAINTECRLIIGNYGYSPCPGNSNGTVCYHSLAVLVLSATESGQKVAFASEREKLDNLNNIHGGRVHNIFSWQSRESVMYMCVWGGRKVAPATLEAESLDNGEREIAAAMTVPDSIVYGE